MLLDEAAKDYDSKPESDLPDDVELPDVTFSEQHEKKMNKIFAAERRKYALKRAGMYASRVAACIGAFAIISCITLVGVNSEFRADIKNFIFNKNDTNIDIRVSDENPTDTYSFGNITLKYIPAGFSVSHTKETGEIKRIHFQNNQKKFDIIIRSIDSDVSIDTEISNFERLDINGMDCFYSGDSNNSMLIIYTGKEICTVYGNISKDDTVQIAQNLKID